MDLSTALRQGNFTKALSAHQWQSLRSAELEIFQINLGKLCNMTCRHCHVDAGPDRRLTLVSNLVGAFLASNQAGVEKEWQS